MRALQAEIIAELHVVPSIDPADEIRKRVDFLKEYLQDSTQRGFVLGISGGQDSALAGRLAQLAVEELRAHDYLAEFFAMRSTEARTMSPGDGDSETSVSPASLSRGTWRSEYGNRNLFRY